MYNPEIGGVLFSLLANYFLNFCSDLAMLIFPSSDIQGPNWKSAQGPHPVNIQSFNPCPFYSFTSIKGYFCYKFNKNSFRLGRRSNFYYNFQSKIPILGVFPDLAPKESIVFLLGVDVSKNNGTVKNGLLKWDILLKLAYGRHIPFWYVVVRNNSTKRWLSTFLRGTFNSFKSK